jgi:hypothetical protein
MFSCHVIAGLAERRRGAEREVERWEQVLRGVRMTMQGKMIPSDLPDFPFGHARVGIKKSLF